MKPIDIFEKQYADARALQLRFAEKGMQSALLGANQAAAQARAILDTARSSEKSFQDCKYVLAIEIAGNFEDAFILKAKTAAAAKKEANKIISSSNSAIVIFFDGGAISRKEAKKWIDVSGYHD